MPDPDRASLPLQIAGQAGNDEKALAMTIAPGNDEKTAGNDERVPAMTIWYRQ